MWSVPDLSPSEVVFLTGAGVSADAPTNGPVGNQLTARALDYAYGPGTLNEVRRGYRAMGYKQSRMPRLEAILEIATQAHGQDILGALLSDLMSAEPNALHTFFARHLLEGGSHLTANFDTAVERALHGAKVLHFHGSLGSGTGGLGATLSRIERGFPDDIAASLRQLLFTVPDRRTLVVAGYSGLDFFDMDPFVVEHGERFASSFERVIWVHHDASALAGELVSVELRGPPMLKTLRAAGVECTVVRGLTASLLDALAVRWGLPELAAQHRDYVEWVQPGVLPEDAKWEATRRLYLHMGMYRSHTRLLTVRPELQSRVQLSDRAALEWQRGRHRRARRFWNVLYAGPGDELLARRLERAAACAWDSGAYLRAYLVCLRAIRAARRAQNPETLALCLELRARVLVHMSRLPDLRWFVTPRRRAKAVRELRSIVATHVFGSSVRPRFEDALELLRRDPEGRDTRSAEPARKWMTWSDSYEQYESLSATLDFRRGEMRRNVASGSAQLTNEWLAAYRTAAEFLGKSAAVASTPLLPGAASLFSWRSGTALLLHAGATPWHRVRMVVMFTREKRRSRGHHGVEVCGRA